MGIANATHRHRKGERIMPSHRSGRINEDVKRELTDILRTVKDPRVSGMLTIVRAEVSNDLSYATVRISAMEGIEQARQSVKGLKAASGYIRRELGQRLKLRKVPELRFVADDSIEHSASIARILHDLEDAPHKEDRENDV